MTPPQPLRVNRHLREDAFGRAAIESFCGMAHVAGSGPRDATCRLCIFWAPPAGLTKHTYYAGKLRPCRCLKYMKLTGRIGGDIPFDAAACRYFEPSDSPPPLFKPKG
jgi:hypothetical protein